MINSLKKDGPYTKSDRYEDIENVVQFSWNRLFEQTSNVLVLTGVCLKKKKNFPSYRENVERKKN